VRHEKNNAYSQDDQDFLLELADAIATGLQRPAI
jgi:hypothetical protein